jgi:cell filamentation protein
LSDPYVDPVAGVLRNRLAIADPDHLARAEAEFAYHAEVRLYAEGVGFSRYDLPALHAVHRQLFAEIYDWAGELRTVDLGKGATTFAHARHLRSAAEQVFRQLAHQDQFRNLAPPRFARGAGRLLADLNALHPFREGNGRAQRVFLQLMARDAGYQLRWADVDPAENLAVSAAAMADPDAFVPLLERILVPASVQLPIDVLRLSRPDPPTVDGP